MSFETHDPIVRDVQECLRTLDAIVADLETTLGPFSAAAAEGEARGALIATTRTALGSEVRHYHNQESGAFTGVASIAGDQHAEARVVIPPAGRARWSCVFRLKVSPPAPLPPFVDDGTPRLRNVFWMERPTGADFARVYPTVAAEVAQNGAVTLDCTVVQAYAISCTVASESPEGWGFGAAALALAEEFRIAPVTRDNIATEGGRVLVPIRFLVE